MNSSLKNKNLNLVKSKSSLQIQEQLNVVGEEIRIKIKSLGDISNLHNDIAFISYVCNLVENVSKPILKGQDKSDLVKQLVIEAFPSLNNEKDLQTIQKSINFLCDSKIVKQISSSAVVTHSLCNFFSKQVIA